MYRHVTGFCIGAALMGVLVVPIGLGTAGCIPGPVPTILLSTVFEADGNVPCGGVPDTADYECPENQWDH